MEGPCEGEGQINKAKKLFEIGKNEEILWKINNKSQSTLKTKMSLTHEDKMRYTKTLATVATGTFAGGTALHLYNVHPTLMKDISIENALKVQKGMTLRIAPLVGSLVVGLGAAGAVYYIAKDRKEALPWLVGSGTLALTFPYTFYFLSPLNTRIKTDQVTASEGPAVMMRWYKFAAGRAVTTFAVFSYFAYLCTKKSEE